jgi:hypothetical protein
MCYNRDMQPLTPSALRREALQHYEQVCHCCGEQYRTFLVVSPTEPAPEGWTVDRLPQLWSMLQAAQWPSQGFTVYCYNCHAALSTVGKCKSLHGGGFGNRQLRSGGMFSSTQAVREVGPLVERMRRRFKGEATELKKELKHRHRAESRDAQATMDLIQKLMGVIKEWQTFERRTLRIAEAYKSKANEFDTSEEGS